MALYREYDYLIQVDPRSSKQHTVSFTEGIANSLQFLKQLLISGCDTLFVFRISHYPMGNSPCQSASIGKLEYPANNETKRWRLGVRYHAGKYPEETEEGHMHDDNRDTPLPPADETGDSFSGDAWMVWLIMLAFFLLLKMA